MLELSSILPSGLTTVVAMESGFLSVACFIAALIVGWDGRSSGPVPNEQKRFLSVIEERQSKAGLSAERVGEGRCELNIIEN